MHQLDRRPARNLVLLLQDPDSFSCLPQFSGLRRRGPGPLAVLDIGLAHPFTHARIGDPEIAGDLRVRQLTLTGDTHHVLTELLRIGLRHDDILSAEHKPHTGQESTKTGPYPAVLRLGGETSPDAP